MAAKWLTFLFDFRFKWNNNIFDNQFSSTSTKDNTKIIEFNTLIQNTTLNLVHFIPDHLFNTRWLFGTQTLFKFDITWRETKKWLDKKCWIQLHYRCFSSYEFAIIYIIHSTLSKCDHHLQLEVKKNLPLLYNSKGVGDPTLNKVRRNKVRYWI